MNLYDNYLGTNDEEIIQEVPSSKLITPQLEDFLKTEEGFRSQAYNDSAGNPTIGIGHKLTEDQLKSGTMNIGGIERDITEGLSEPEARLLKRQHLLRDADYLKKFVDPSLLSDNDTTALLSRSYNLGQEGAFGTPRNPNKVGKALQAINTNPTRAQELLKLAAANFDETTADGKELKALVDRREKEASLMGSYNSLGELNKTDRARLQRQGSMPIIPKDDSEIENLKKELTPLKEKPLMVDEAQLPENKTEEQKKAEETPENLIERLFRELEGTKEELDPKELERREMMDAIAGVGTALANSMGVNFKAPSSFSEAYREANKQKTKASKEEILEKYKLAKDLKNAEKLAGKRIISTADGIFSVDPITGELNQINENQATKIRLEQANQRLADADKIKGKPLETLRDLNTTASLMNVEISPLLKEAKTLMGPIKGAANKTLDQLSLADPRFAKLTSFLNIQLADYIRSISGTAASDAERVALKDNQPLPTDTYDKAMIKLDNIKQYVYRKQFELLNAERLAGGTTDAFEEDISKRFPDSIIAREYSARLAAKKPEVAKEPVRSPASQSPKQSTPETREINGKLMRKVPGGWIPVK